MNKNAKKWVEALRSGKYEQGCGYLRTNDGFCCLGVACDLYAKAHPRAKGWNQGNLFAGEMMLLPVKVRKWLGLTKNSGVFTDKKGFLSELIDLNDSGKTFKQIAKIIESEPEGLFVK